jgi:capsular exopolysaccharide synthesis family protein
LVKKASVDERQIFMVSSAGPSEGKSTLAQNLWTGLSEANYRCLLVDMDFRRPSIHRYLNVDIGLGVSDALSGKVEVDTVIRSIDGQRYFMTAGESRQLNLAAMASDALPKFFDYLRGHYDFIIVDSAPILPVVDSRVIGEHVDGAVLSTIRDRSRLPQLIAAIELLKAHDTDILGVVVSGFGSGTYGYSYYRS